MLVRSTGILEQKVHKHVAAIHCSGELTLFQRKIINCLLYNAFPTLCSENKFKINIRELLNLLGLKNNDYQYLRDAFKNIRKTDITWNLTNESFYSEKETGEFESWLDCSWLSWTMSDGSSIYYEFPEPLKAYLVQPSVYGSISLTIQQKFTSKFALILYENCMRYVNIGKTKLFSLDTFRNIMGIKTEQYKNFRDLTSRVLNPAINQVNLYSEIDVSVIKKKESRRVVALQFILRKKKDEKVKKSIVPVSGDSERSAYLKFVVEFRGLQETKRKLILDDFLKYLNTRVHETPGGDDRAQYIIQYFYDCGWNTSLILRSVMNYYKGKLP